MTTIEAWIWEYSTLDGITVYDTTEYWSLAAVKAAVDASFNGYVWEEVERRGIRGTSVLVKQSSGRYVDRGHWVYRRPEVLPPWFPGVPGSRWRDSDGDVWTHGDDGHVYMGRRPGEPATPELVHRKYGPMTPIGGA